MRLFSLMLLVVSAMLAGPPAIAQDKARYSALVVLGQETVRPGENATVVAVNRPQARFSKVRLKVREGNLLIYDVRVRYTDDLVQDVDVRQESRADRNAVEIDAPGNARGIRQIELRYRALPRGQTAVVEFTAEDFELKQVLDQYEVVATERIDTAQDRVVIPVGRREGRLTDLRLRALDEDVFIRRVTVDYPRGEQQEVRMRDRLLAGEVSDNIDLSGESRFVREVTVDLGRNWVGTRRPFRLQLLAKVDRSRPSVRESAAGVVAGIPPGWVSFGEHTVGFRGDRDVIQVGRNAGQFDRIALRVTDNDVFLDEVVIIYGNGERDVKRIRQEIPANGRTGFLEIKGDRYIEQIELGYRSTGVRRGRATVALFGEYSDQWKRRGSRDDREPARGRGQWVKLGEQRAQMIGKDWDTINVGREKGRFRAIKIKIARHDVQIHAIRVIYSNGEVESLPFSGTIDDGRESPVIDIKGRDRSIERIEVRHKTKFNLKGEGVTEVWALD